jgi:hypothetical protein
MNPSQYSYPAGTAAAHLARSREIRLWAISHASDQLLRVWQESQQPGVSRELAPSLLLGELDWNQALHELLYDWSTDDAEHYYRAHSQHDATNLCRTP